MTKSLQILHPLNQSALGPHLDCLSFPSGLPPRGMIRRFSVVRLLGTGIAAMLGLLASAIFASDRPLRILISNDDGIDHQGIAALAEELRKKHEVVVIAPDQDRTGAGHSFAKSKTIQYKLTARHKNGRLFGYAIDGTPAESVLLGITAFGKSNRFDLVVSGINPGANVGMLHLASGTEGAARQGVLMGIPALAFSQAGRPTNFVFAARFASRLIELLRPELWQQPSIWSVNFPTNISRVKGVKLVPSDTRLAIDSIVVKEIKSVEGAELYQLGINPNAPAGKTFNDNPEQHELDADYITVSPVGIQLLHEPSLKALKKRSAEFERLMRGFR